MYLYFISLCVIAPYGKRVDSYNVIWSKEVGGETMSVDHYREQCNRFKGRPVRIETSDGCVHRGIIEDVDNRYVFIRPMEQRNQLGGFGYGFGFGGYGSYEGPYRIALGAIAGIALLSLFFW